MEEIINVDILPSWLKEGGRIKVISGARRGCYGYVEEIKHRTAYDDDEYRIRCHLPGVTDQDEYFYIKHLVEYR